MMSQASKKKVEMYLKNMREAAQHYTIKDAGVGYWYQVYFLGIAVLATQLILSFYNPYFAKTDKVFFNWMWPIYLGGSVVLLTNIALHDTHSEFCTVKLAQNHVLEMGILLCMRSVWWTSIQAWSWSQSYWYLIPILGGFALEWAFYALTLWGRHRRTCPYHANHGDATEKMPRLRPLMLTLDFLWAISQAMALVVGVLYDDELLV